MRLTKIIGFALIVMVGLQVVGAPIASAWDKGLIFSEEVYDTTDVIQARGYQSHTVFSNRTNLFYHFYYNDNDPDSGGFMYEAIGLYGEKVISRSKILTNTPNPLTPTADFDVCIDEQGDRILIVYSNEAKTLTNYKAPSIWTCGYILVNEETRDLDFVNSKGFDTIDPTALGSWSWRNPDVEILRDNTIVLTMSSASKASAVFWINSTTAWNAVDTWATGDDLCIALDGYNPSNDGHQMAVTPWNDGFAVFWRSWDAGNAWMDRQRIFVTNRPHDAMNGAGSVVAGRWRSKNIGNQIYLPDDLAGLYYIDIVSFETDNITAVWSEQDVTDTFTRTRKWHYNYTSDTAHETNLWNNTNPDQRVFFSLTTNQRGNMALLWVNETGDLDPHLFRYNASIESWDTTDHLLFDVDAPTFDHYAGGNKFALAYDAELTPGSLLWDGSLSWGWYTLDGGEVAGVPSLENATLLDSSGQDVEWLFEGEVYTLSFDTNNETENGFITFSDGDANMTINFNVTENRAWINQDNEEFKATLVEQDRSGTYSWNLTFVLGEGIDDSVDVDFGYSVTNFDHNITVTGSYLTNRKIYNLGGFTMNRDRLNLAGWYPAGNPLECYSQYNASTSWVNTSQVYRKIQLYHSQFSLDVEDNVVFDTLENTGDIEIHLQYYNGSGWYDLIYVAFDIPKGAVDPAGAGAGKAWIDIAWNWYGRNDAGNMASVRNGYFVAYPDCGDDVNADVSTAQFWVDFWIDKANNSRAVGGNFNPYYYGMDETGWLLFNSWRPITTNTTFSTVTIPLRDPSGNIIQADEIDLMRVATWVITGSAGDTNQWSIRDFKNQDIQLAEGRLRGIDKPALVETLVVDMPSTGFLSGLRKAIQGIGEAIKNGLSGVWKTTIGLIDTILEFLGLPKGIFASLIFVINELLALFDAIIVQFDELVSYAVGSMTQAVLLVVAVAGRIVFTVTEFVSSILAFWNQIVRLFTGEWENVGNLWQSLDILVWVQFFLIAYFPFWEYDRISRSDNPIATIKGDIEGFWGLITSMFRVFAFLWDLVKGIFELILGVVRG